MVNLKIKKQSIYAVIDTDSNEQICYDCTMRSEAEELILRIKKRLAEGKTLQEIEIMRSNEL